MICLSFVNTPTRDWFCAAGDVFGCHKGGRDALSTFWVNSGNAAKHLICWTVFPNPKIISLKMSTVQRRRVSALDPRAIHSFIKTSSNLLFYFSTKSSKAYFWSFRKTSAFCTLLCTLVSTLYTVPFSYSSSDFHSGCFRLLPVLFWYSDFHRLWNISLLTLHPLFPVTPC